MFIILYFFNMFNFLKNNFFIIRRYLPQVLLVFNLVAIFIFLIIIVFAFGFCFPEVIFADEGQSVMELDGWAKDSNLESIKPFPWEIAFAYFSLNLFIYFSFSMFFIPDNIDPEVLSIITSNLSSVNEVVSAVSLSNSNINSLSTALSGVPSIPNTSDLYPILAKTTDLSNYQSAQSIYDELLQKIDPNDPNFNVYKVFISHAKRIYFQALCDGLEPGTVGFSQYLDDTLLNNRALVNYMAHHGVRVLDLLE